MTKPTNFCMCAIAVFLSLFALGPVQAQRNEPATIPTPRLPSGEATLQQTIPITNIPGLLNEFPITTIETGFLNEINQEGFREWFISAPGNQPFRWGTDWKDADEGIWRLRTPSQRGGMTILATGVATSETFDIDLRKHLPAQPPEKPALYFVDILARKKGGVTNTGASTSGGSTKVAPKELGAWSVPVLLTYGKNTAAPTRFGDTTRYRRMALVLDYFEADDLQAEIGNEEYKVAGLFQELYRNCHDEKSLDCGYKIPGFGIRFGVYEKTLNPGKKKRKFGELVYDPYQKKDVKETHRWEIGVDSPSGAPLARSFMVMATVLEVDNGASLGDWQASIISLKKGIYLDKILELGEGDLQSWAEKYGPDVANFALDVASIVIDVAADAGGAVIPVAGVVVFAATTAAGAIIHSIPDDYCGASSAALTLPTLNIEEVHQIPGKVVGSGEDMKFISDPVELEWKCPPGFNSADGGPGAWGQTVVHWEFSDPATSL